MKTLAITGSSGSGKTTISKLFLNFEGTFLVNTDELARKMSENDDKYLQEIVDEFGKSILEENGKLNRKKLSYIIGNNPEAKNKLNVITKRNLMPKLNNIISENKDKKLIIIDVPILYENELENYFDKVLAVISSKEEQIKRICTRDKLNKEEANLRLNMQLDNQFFIDNADFIIENIEKTEEDLLREIEKIYNVLFN